MIKASRKNLLVYILMPLIISSLSAVLLSNTNSIEIVNDSPLQELRLSPIEDMNPEENKLNYLVIASNQLEYENWRNTYNVLTEYPNLMALEVEITNSELSNLQKTSDSKPIRSKLLRSSIESFTMTNSLPQISLNGNDEADLMKVSDLWGLGYNGTGVVVAVFDNGINFSHEALVGQNYSDPVLFNEVNGQTYTPCKVHGTPVGGLIASTGTGAYASTIGTAFGSKLVSMEMGCDGGNLLGDPIAGFDWLAGQNETIKIINLSWGAGTGLIFEEIINRLAQLGIVAVVSAGNVDNVSLQNKEFMIMDPASAIGSIAVGAVTDALIPTSFSALGPNLKYGTKPDIVAPGSALAALSSGGGLTSFTGTSGSAPLVSGAIATLISGLEDKNLPWNVGTIKAALMRSAMSLPYDELKVGQGLVNLNATWQYLMDAVTDERGPMVLEITPSNGPYQLYDTFPVDSVGFIPISIISSHPDLVNVEIVGNLSQILSHQFPLTNDYSQIVYLETSTTGITEGLYTGYINASIGNDFVLSEFSITVIGKPTKKVLLDLRHTNWDISNSNNIGGTNIGEMIKLAQSKGMWVHEINVELTSALLSEYDIVWLPDPFDLADWTYNRASPLFASEIAALTKFVDEGGSLLVDFLGTYVDQGYTTGTNSSELNSLISHFDITASSIPNDDVVGTTALLKNVTSFVGGVTSITHYGNYLDIGPMAQEIATDKFGTTIGSYQNDNGGKVLISSTNFWLDNAGVNGLYNELGDEGDKILSNNLWNWFSNNDSIKIFNNEWSQNNYEINFKVHTNDQNSTPELKATWSEFGLNQGHPIIISNITEFLNINVEFPNDGKYEILIEYGDEYRRLFVILDTTPPIIQSLQINQTGFETGIEKMFLFQLTDEQSDINISNIKAFLDGVELTTVTYSESTSILSVSISGSIMTQTNHWFELKIEVTDNYSNLNSILYVFYVGEKPIDTFSKSSSTISTSDSNVTTSVSSGLPNPKGSSGFIVLSLTVITITLITLSVSYRLRKRSD
ncbi:MAG: S8 family peptidase [Candidatus Heimdallarchaeota archaeon]|nr:S8 family peptidase [Candidatus Heimdallarchaeota archaeon]